MENNFVCCICHKIPSDVVESACCNSLFCWNCVIGVPQPCPSCGKELDAATCIENLAVKKIVEAIEVKCTYIGCLERFSVSERSNHEASCVKGPTLCPNSDLCGIIDRGSLVQHLVGCQYRRIECHMCEMSLPLPHLQDHLDTDCQEVVAECQLCREKMVRKTIPAHIANDCPSVETECPYACYGCTETPMRVQMDVHAEEGRSRHMRLMSKAIKAQQRQIVALREDLVAQRAVPVAQFDPTSGVLYQLDQRLTEFVNSMKNSHGWRDPSLSYLRAQVTPKRIVALFCFFFYIILSIAFSGFFFWTGFRAVKAVIKIVILVKLCTFGVKSVCAGTPWVRHRQCVAGIALPLAFLLYWLIF